MTSVFQLGTGLSLKSLPFPNFFISANGSRIIPHEGQEQKPGGFEKMQSVIYNTKTKGNAKKR